MASASITINVNKRGFDEAIACLESMTGRIDEAARMWVQRSTDILHDEAVATINKRTGRTAGTVDSAVEGLTGYVGTDDKVGVILELGSMPHPIPPRVLPPREHPGTPEYAWLVNAGEASELAIEGLFEGMIGAALESC